MQKQLLFIIIVTFGLKCNGIVIDFDDEDFFGNTADEYNFNNHPCKRKCTNDTVKAICRYVFVVEQFETMSKACYNCPFNITDCNRSQCIIADGMLKAVYTVNRQIPGPLIEVCVNDIIEVEVRNRMQSDSTVVHWHGIKQHGTPYMDGVQYVTQCPILPSDSFRYIFKASKPGTYFWHSHIGYQRMDGDFGALVIKNYEKNEHFINLYDYDIHRMIVIDWMHKTGTDGFNRQYYFNPDVIATNILINGLGPKKKFVTSDGEIIQTPFAVFEVEQNKSYRMRYINAGSQDCAIEMKIDNHKELIISLDSNDIEPVEVDVMMIWQGERIDYILKANQKIGNYWMRFRGLGECQSSGPGPHQGAILRYKGAKIENPPGSFNYDKGKPLRDPRILNPFNVGTEIKAPWNVEIPNLYALADNDISLKKHADHQIFIEMDLYPIDNYDYQRAGLFGYHEVPDNRAIGTFQFNRISYKVPPVPLLSQWDMIDPSILCNETNIPKKCVGKFCACTYVINLKLNSVVELVLFDQGKSGYVVNHPLHLHGYFFYVVAMKNLGRNLTMEQMKQLDKEGKIQRNLNHPPLKDTIKIPTGGYTIVRFLAHNPGYWYFHCHLEDHNDIGMALVFKVGEHEDFPPKPKNFPRCGNFLPDAM